MTAQQILRGALGLVRPPQSILEIDYSTITVTTCPTCGSNRCAEFDVVHISPEGVGVLTRLRRCYACSPLDPPTH